AHERTPPSAEGRQRRVRRWSLGWPVRATFVGETGQAAIARRGAAAPPSPPARASFAADPVVTLASHHAGSGRSRTARSHPPGRAGPGTGADRGGIRAGGARTGREHPAGQEVPLLPGPAVAGAAFGGGPPAGGPADERGPGGPPGGPGAAPGGPPGRTGASLP